MKSLLVVAVLVTILTLSPALPCHTLSHYLENTTKYFTSNTRISFLHGMHKINKSGMLHIQDDSSLTLTGNNVSSKSACTCLTPASLII